MVSDPHIVKICGLSTRAAIAATAAGGATHAGFIFFEKSPRHVELSQAAELGAAARALGLKTVAVTVDAADEKLAAIVAALQPDVLQLHGNETPARLAEVKARFARPVWKALAIRDAGDFAKLQAFRGIADAFLFDAKPPVGSDLPGGNGVTFDWSLLGLLDADLPYVLSGGLDLDNVAGAIMMAAPPGIDVSSGVESAPGIKSEDKIAAFLAAVDEARKARVTTGPRSALGKKRDGRTDA